MITLKREDGNTIQLQATVMQRLLPKYEHLKWQKVRRSDLAKFFRSRINLLTRGRQGLIDGNFGDEPNQWFQSLWTLREYPALKNDEFPVFAIGCVKFNRAELKVIRKWALARRKP